MLFYKVGKNSEEFDIISSKLQKITTMHSQCCISRVNWKIFVISKANRKFYILQLFTMPSKLNIWNFGAVQQC